MTYFECDACSRKQKAENQLGFCKGLNAQIIDRDGLLFKTKHFCGSCREAFVHEQKNVVNPNREIITKAMQALTTLAKLNTRCEKLALPALKELRRLL